MVSITTSSQGGGAANCGTSYKEYLRSQFIYKDFKDLELRSFPAIVSTCLSLKLLVCV